MNYRHIFHAGNFADVIKHVVLSMLLQSLSKKEKGFLYLDTHAGIGRYDLTTEIAQKTREFNNGIAKIYDLQECPAEILTYKNIVRDFNKNGPLRFYPGSPYIAAALLRPQDQMILSELHPEDAKILKHEFANNHQVAVHHLDGYQSIKAFLPAKNGRGLVMIDPPFEETNEFDKVITALQLAKQRFMQGVYLIWFPIKDIDHVKNFYFKIKGLNFKDAVFIEFAIGNASTVLGLSKCGLAILNTPWQFTSQLQPVLTWLHNTLALDATTTPSPILW